MELLPSDLQNVLEDNIVLCESGIKKSQRLLTLVQNNPEEVNMLQHKIIDLFKKMKSNIEIFVNKLSHTNNGKVNIVANAVNGIRSSSCLKRAKDISSDSLIVDNQKQMIEQEVEHLSDSSLVDNDNDSFDSETTIPDSQTKQSASVGNEDVKSFEDSFLRINKKDQVYTDSFDSQTTTIPNLKKKQIRSIENENLRYSEDSFLSISTNGENQVYTDSLDSQTIAIPDRQIKQRPSIEKKDLRLSEVSSVQTNEKVQVDSDVFDSPRITTSDRQTKQRASIENEDLRSFADSFFTINEEVQVDTDKENLQLIKKHDFLEHLSLTPTKDIPVERSRKSRRLIEQLKSDSSEDSFNVFNYIVNESIAIKSEICENEEIGLDLYKENSVDNNYIKTEDNDDNESSSDDLNFFNNEQSALEMINKLNDCDSIVPDESLEYLEQALMEDSDPEIRDICKYDETEGDFKRSDQEEIKNHNEIDDNDIQTEESDETERDFNISDQEEITNHNEIDDNYKQTEESDGSSTDVDRLCNKINLRKRKRQLNLETSPKNNKIKKRLKKKNKLSSSSSTCSEMADSSDFDDIDLDMSRNGIKSPPKMGEEAKQCFIDMMVQQFEYNSDVSMESWSDNENLNNKTRKKVTKGCETTNNKKNVNTVIKTEETDTDTDINTETEFSKGNSHWRNHPLLNSDSHSSIDNASEKESDEDIKKAEKPKKARKKLKKKRKCTSCNKTGNGLNIDLSSDDTIISCDDWEENDVQIITEEDDLTQLSSSQIHGRKNIRPVIEDKELTQRTLKAKKEEEKRIERLMKHSRTMESIHSQPDEMILDFDPVMNKNLVTVHPLLVEKLQPHQKEGLQFMWEACYESIEMIKKNKGTGCILAHSMGLGKTIQVLVLIHTLFAHKNTETNHVLIVCPLTTVINWEKEIKKVFSNLQQNFNLFTLVKGSQKEKCAIIKSWRDKTGILIMGYDAYIYLTNEEKKSRKITIEAQQQLNGALVNPGPDLIVCDEGHLIKNGNSLRNQTLNRIKTKRRIILTGTPLQNSLKEYYFMVEFVKPNLLGTFQEYENGFVNPIMNGHYYNSTEQDVKLMKKRTHVLNELLKKTIHRVESSVLKDALPEFYDYAILIRLNREQGNIYKKYLDYARSEQTNKKFAGFLLDFQILQYISLHPFILLNKNLLKNRKKKEKETLDTELNTDQIRPKLAKAEFLKKLCPLDAQNKIEYGTKLTVLFNIIHEVQKLEEKILIFTLSLYELDLIEHFLKLKNFTPHVHYLRMDGTVPPDKRNKLCEQFNSKLSSVKIFLISHKVGGLGLNLTAGTRIVLMSSNFNPCYDMQSIYRAYRIGQDKPCYVYRLIAMDTMDEKVYKKCVLKLSVATTVIDKHHVDRHFEELDLLNLYKYDFIEEERQTPQPPQDKVLAQVILQNKNCYRWHHHKDFLENRPEEELNNEEKELAWEEYKQGNMLNRVEVNKNPGFLLNNIPNNELPSMNVNKELPVTTPTTTTLANINGSLPNNNVPFMNANFNNQQYYKLPSTSNTQIVNVQPNILNRKVYVSNNVNLLPKTNCAQVAQQQEFYFTNLLRNIENSLENSNATNNPMNLNNVEKNTNVTNIPPNQISEFNYALNCMTYQK